MHRFARIGLFLVLSGTLACGGGAQAPAAQAPAPQAAKPAPASQPAAQPAPAQPAQSAPAPAKSGKVTKIAMTNPLNPGEPTADGMNDFKKEVEEKSGGQIQVEVFVSGQLGKAEETVEMVKSGAAQMIITSPQYLSKFLPEIQVITLPYLFDNGEALDKALDGPVGAEISTLVEQKTDFKIFAFEEFGIKHVFNRRRSVNTIDDLKGLKLRVINSPITIKSFEALGASPIGMDFNELYTAIQTGVVDGGEIPFATIRSSKMHEVAKFISTTGHFYEIAMVYGNKAFFNGLPADQQKIVADAAQNMAKKARKVSRDSQQGARDFMAGQGVTINDVKPEELAKMRSAVRPVYDWAKQQWGDAYVGKVLTAVGK